MISKLSVAAQNPFKSQMYLHGFGLLVAAVSVGALIAALTPAHENMTAPDPVPKPEAGKQQTIDLKGFYNARLSDSWMNPAWIGNDLSSLGEGTLRFKEIVFDVRGVLQLEGLELQKINRRFPTQMAGIPIGQDFCRLFLLHSTAWSAADGTVIAFVRLNYEDGLEEQLPVKYGIHVRNWSHYPEDSAKTTGSWVAWTGRNGGTPARVKLELYATMFKNPRPSVKVTSVSYCSTMSSAAPFLLAMTIERR